MERLLWFSWRIVVFSTKVLHWSFIVSCRVAIGADIKPIKLISCVTDSNKFHWLLDSVIWAQSELLLLSNLSFWLQMITAANTLHATVLFRPWFRVKVSYFYDTLTLINYEAGGGGRHTLWLYGFDLFSRVASKNLDSWRSIFPTISETSSFWNWVSLPQTLEFCNSFIWRWAIFCWKGAMAFCL